MTAPTQPPDPRVQRIADALCAYDVREMNATEAARVLVEELGGREDEAVPVTEKIPRFKDGQAAAWLAVCELLDELTPQWERGGFTSCDNALHAIRTLAAQQRENAETIQALRERVETAEAANTELDHARQSAEQSARDLRENNATIRAELDAITGAQVPYRWTVVSEDRLSFTFTSVESAQTWAKNEGGEVIPLFTHPAPALPVVGACVVSKDGDAMVAYYSDSWGDLGRKEENAQEHAKRKGGTAHQLLLGAPLSTEGGR